MDYDVRWKRKRIARKLVHVAAIPAGAHSALLAARFADALTINTIWSRV